MSTEQMLGLLNEIRQDAERILEKVEKLEMQLGKTTTKEPPANLKNKLLVLWKVKKDGGVASQEDVREEWLKLGNSARGFGSLFRGYGRLIQIAGNKVALSPEAEELIQKYRFWLEAQENS
ncbi:MAG: hypothetical protein ABGW77_06515 [Campylobacterales bacterium]|jgi:hypothetical protein